MIQLRGETCKNCTFFYGKRRFYFQALAVAEFAFLSFAVSSIAHVMDHRWDEETDGGSESYAEVYYEAHIENGVTSGFLAAAVFIIVCVTCDRWGKEEEQQQQQQQH